MPAQYALTYYLGSAILGSILLSVLVILLVNIPNGTFYLDGTGIVFLMSCGIAMVGSLPFHAWLNWVWYKKVGSQPYEDFFKSFLRKYWVGSSLYPFTRLLSLGFLKFSLPGTMGWDPLGLTELLMNSRVLSAVLDLLCPFGMVDHKTIERGDAA